MFLSAFDCKMGYTFAFCQTEIYRNSWKLSWKLVCNAREWCTFLKPDTMYCYTPCNTLKVLIPSSLFKEVQEDTISLAAASAPPSVRSRLWSHQLFSSSLFTEQLVIHQSLHTRSGEAVCQRIAGLNSYLCLSKGRGNGRKTWRGSSCILTPCWRVLLHQATSVSQAVSGYTPTLSCICSQW